MSLGHWSDRNESLNALCAAIQQGAHGLVRNLSHDLIDDDSVVVRGDSHSYYGVQLAIFTTKQFVHKHRLFGVTRLLMSVDGNDLELVVIHSSNDDARESSTHAAKCRPQLTAVVPA